MCTQMVQCSALHAQTAYNSVMSTQMVESFGICMQMKMGSAVCAQLVEYSVYVYTNGTALCFTCTNGI